MSLIPSAFPLSSVPRQTQPRLRVVASTSGKGGVGKTTVTCNLAVLAGRAGQRILMVDADLGLANVEILFGVRPRHHLGDLLDEKIDIHDILCNGPEGIKILSAGSGLQHLTKLEEEQKQRLIGLLDPLENDFDVIFLDTGAGIGDNVLFFAGAAQEVLLVVSAEPTSLTDAYATVKVLSQQAHVRTFHVVVNPVANESAARDIFQKLTAVTTRFLEANVNYLGFIPRDEAVHRAVMAQKPVVEMFPHCPAAQHLELLHTRLFNRRAPPPLEGGLKFLWQRVLRESTLPPG